MTSLLRDRRFVAFLSVQALSAFGDAFSFTAVPLLVLDVTGSATAMGVVKGLDAVAAIAGGLVAGVVADRFSNRRLRMLRICDLLRFALYASVPLVWFLASPQVWLLFVVLPVAGCCSMVFQVTYVTVVPGLVPAGRITEANGILYGAFSAAFLAGPVLAGLVSGRLGPAAAFGVDATTFLLSAAGLTFVRIQTTASPRAANTDRTALRFLWRHPVLRPLTALLAVLVCCTTALDDVVIYQLKTHLHRSDTVVGAVLAAGVVGSLLASVVVARLRRRFGFGRVWIVSYTCCGALIAGVGLADGPTGIAVLVAGVAVGTGVAGIASMSLRQEVTPDALLGRVTSAFWSLQLTLAPLGAVVLTTAAGQFGVTPALVTAGAICSATALTAIMTPIAGAATGDTATGDTATGDTATGDTATGDTATGDTATGAAAVSEAPVREDPTAPPTSPTTG